MSKKKILIFIIATILMIPAYTYATTGDPANPTCENATMGDLKNILVSASCLLTKYVIPFLFSLAIVAFIWGIIQFYLNPDNEEKRKKGKSYIVGGLIALFVMTSIWGIINIMRNTLGTDGNNTPNKADLPSVDIGS